MDVGVESDRGIVITHPKVNGRKMRSRKTVLGVVRSTGKLVAWLAGISVALFGIGAMAQWLIGTTFVTRDAAASDYATKAELENVKKLEAEHFSALKAAIDDVSKSNKEIHDYILYKVVPSPKSKE